MQTITLAWDVSDLEFALLQRLVAAEGVKGETVEAYAGRVGLKGLRGALSVKVQALRDQSVDALTKAFDAADVQAKAAALDPLGYVLTADGSVQPKEVKP